MLIPCSEGCGLAFCCFCLFRFCLLSWWFFNRKKKNPNVFKTASDSPFPGALVFCMAFTALSSQLSASGVRLAGPAFQLGCLGAGSC